MNGLILTNATAKDRRELDYYPTPENVTIALCEFLKDYCLIDLSGINCIEPACGDGRMSKILEKYFKNVYSSDIQSKCYGIGDCNYLIDNFKNNTLNPPTALITNPLFAISKDFIEKAISENHFIIAMLLKSQYWHSKKRYKLFQESRPTYILPLTWRPDFYFGEKSGSPTMECLWTVWISDRKKLECIYYPLGKPLDER